MAIEFDVNAALEALKSGQDLTGERDFTAAAKPTTIIRAAANPIIK